jgi:hypothetical protein
MWSYKLSLLSLVLFLGSCSLNPCGNSKAKFLERMNELSELAAKSEWAYSDARWGKHDESFKLLVEQCYEQFESELSGREKRRFWTQSLRYQYKRVGSGMSKELLDPKDGKLKQWRNELESLPKEEMRELLDDIEKDLNNWSDQLREIFK